MLQTASDVFLGWTRDDDNRSYYFRQLRDMKMKIDISKMSQDDFFEYIELCGWALARGHARTGDPVKIGRYLARAIHSMMQLKNSLLNMPTRPSTTTAC